MFICFYFFLAYRIVKIVGSQLKKYAKFNEVCESRTEQFFPFVRFDYPYWSKYKLYLGAIFLVPWRLILIICCVVSCFFTVKISLIGANLNKPILGIRRKMIHLFSSTLCRSILFIAGIYKINVVREKIEKYIPNYQTKDKNQKAPMVICNHVSWVDTLCMISILCPSFVAKEEVSHIPVVGFVAKALQALFVDRESRSDKDLIMKKIQERCTLFKNCDGLPQLLIFPEGTNTNGKSMLHFKRGAFNNYENLQVICLEYQQQPFNLMIDDLGIGTDILMALCWWKHHLTVHVFDVFNPEYLGLKGDDDWEKYASVVQKMMQDCLKTKSCNLGYRDSLDFTELLREYHVIEGKMNVHNEHSPEKKLTNLVTKKNE